MPQRAAIVTGASSGIGLGLAHLLGQEGHALTIAARRPEKLEEARAELVGAGHDVVAVAADLGDEEGIRSVVAAHRERHDRLDVLVNNAGQNVPDRAMAEVSPSSWQTVLDVNLTGTFLPTRAALPVMREQGSGTVVNVSSVAGHRASELTGPAYSAAKAGVVSFTESLNLAERRHGIRACVVCPGEVATPIMQRRPVPPTAEALAAMLQPEDLADTVLAVVALPQRAAVEFVLVRPTSLRPDSP